MFTIRHEQLEVLTAPIIAAFKARLSVHLKQFFPAECETLGDEGLSEAVDYGLDRARSHGLRSENHVTKYLNLVFTLGRDFDTNPDFAWARELLALACLNEKKMSRLIARAVAEADRGRGFLAEQGSDPFEPTLSLRQRPFTRSQREEWIESMTELVSYSCRTSRHLRWDDTEDLTGTEHLESIVEVARRTSKTRHWLPTRAHDVVREFLDGHPEGFPRNLLLRIGAPGEETPAPEITTLTTSTIQRSAPKTGARCPAKFPGARCGECRICWDSDVRNVSFHPNRWRSNRKIATDGAGLTASAG